MYPTRVASAAWVFASSPSKVPFYVAGALLAGWAVGLALTGITHREFPGSAGRARLVMLTSLTLVGVTIAMAIVTAGEPGEEGEAPDAGPAPTSRTLALTADPGGDPTYDESEVAVRAGRIEVRLRNRSSVPHNITIASDSDVVTATTTITGSDTATTANLQPGSYVFFCSVDAHREAGMEGTLNVR
jgi:plastocyanin